MSNEKLSLVQQWLYQFMFVDPNKLTPFPINSEYMNIGQTLDEMNKNGYIKSMKLNKDGAVILETRT